MLEDELLTAKCIISESIDKGWIRLSFSLYRATVLVIHKKTGELHIVIDYHLLDKYTHIYIYIYAYLITYTNELLDRLAKAQYLQK